MISNIMYNCYQKMAIFDEKIEKYFKTKKNIHPKETENFTLILLRDLYMRSYPDIIPKQFEN